ncbi:hypothetical protein ACFLU6_13150 [Acidobacteriota bacterium]
MVIVRLFNVILTGLFEGILYPFRGSPWLGMVIVSVLTGIFMLIIFKYTSNQEAIRRTKNLLKAGFLELWLFRNDFRSQIGTTLNILGNNFRYMRYALTPMLFLIIPFIFILVQLDLRYGYRPLEPGEPAILTVTTDGSVGPGQISLSVPEGVTVESPALRIPLDNEVNWKVSAAKEGRFELSLKTGTANAKKILVSSDRLLKVPRIRNRTIWSWQGVLFHPGEPPLEAPYESIEIGYPASSLRLFGLSMHWIIPFLILSIAFGFGLKGVFGVEV